MTRVVETNLSFDNVKDDELYWLDKERYEKSKQNKFVKLKLIKKTNEKLLSFELLKENGLLANLQGGIRIDGKLLEYINGVVENILIEDLTEIKTYLEGKEQTVLVNKYERNPQARAKCLEHYGYSCQVCNFNFEKTYGDLGKGFIHVHHIEHISQQGGEYEVDPIKDLIPVCPNCHAMLHKKNNEGNYLNIKQLKNML